MMLEAMIAGEFSGGRTLLDSSSGNAGIAYAMIGAMMRVPVSIVVPEMPAASASCAKAHGADSDRDRPHRGIR